MNGFSAVARSYVPSMIAPMFDKPLSAQEVADVEAIVPPGAIEGSRYQAAQMAHLDSEK